MAKSKWIRGSVGKKKGKLLANNERDVRMVQLMLNLIPESQGGTKENPIPIVQEPKFGPRTEEAIKVYQEKQLGKVYGFIGPTGRTIKKLTNDGKRWKRARRTWWKVYKAQMAKVKAEFIPQPKAKIVVTRSGEVFKHVYKGQKQPAYGEWGTMVVTSADGEKTHTFHTLERRGGYVALKPQKIFAQAHYSSKLNSRAFAAASEEFKWFVEGTKVNSLMPKHKQTKLVDGKKKTLQFLIHAGSRPASVTGCIAPGKSREPKSQWGKKKIVLKEATAAMKLIFEAMAENPFVDLVIKGTAKHWP